MKYKIEEMGDYENAITFVNKALDLKPDCKEAIELKKELQTAKNIRYSDWERTI